MLAAFKHAVSSLKEVAAGGVPRGVVTLGEHRGSVRCVAFSPDGRHAATASGDNTLAVWDLRSASKRLDLGTVPENLTGGGVGAGHRHIVTSVAFSPDGGFVASASHDKTLRVWSMQDGSALATFIGHMQIVTSVQFQPTASAAGAWRLLSASVDATVRLWRLDHDGESDWSLFPWGNGVTLEFAFAHTQASFLSDDHADSEHFRRRTNRQRKHLPAMKCDLVTLSASSPVVCSQFTEDGERIVAASSDGSIKVWATASALQGGAEAKVLLQIAGRGVRIESLSIFGSSPTHRQAGLIAVGCRDAAVDVYSLENGKMVQSFDNLKGFPVALSFWGGEGDVLLACCGAIKLAVLHVPSGRCLKHWPLTGASLTAFALSPFDGGLVAASGANQVVFEADAHSRLVEALCVCGANEDRADARSHMSVMHNGAPASSKGLGRAARSGCGQSDGLPLLAPDADEAHLGSVESSAAELVRSPRGVFVSVDSDAAGRRGAMLGNGRNATFGPLHPRPMDVQDDLQRSLLHNPAGFNDAHEDGVKGER